MFLFLTLAYSIPLEREDLDTSHIKILDDQTMRDKIKKVKQGFVLFHADHQRMSDVAYSSYVKVSEKYKDKAEFFVVPASVGADVSRTYSVPGNPCLLYFRMGTKLGMVYGLYSRDSIERFVSNWTKPTIPDFKYRENVTSQEIWDSFGQLFPDQSSIVVLLGDSDTKFGRTAIELTQELGAFFPFMKIADKEIANRLGMRYPSLVMVRFEDSQTSVYTGEPDLDEMFIWVQHNSIPRFRDLDSSYLFSPDGVAVKSAIAFMDVSDGEQRDAVFPLIGKRSALQNWIKLYYADIYEWKSLAKLFGIEKTPSILLLSANYTSMQYLITDLADNTTFTKFFEDELDQDMKTVATPVELYGGLRPVTEFAFEKMAEEGPFFTLFSSAFCMKCKTLRMAAFDAAQTILRNGGKTRWAFWDVTKATPSFQGNLSVSVPSVWYFPTTNITGDAIPYMGPQNFLSIIEWAHGMLPDSFDLDTIMDKELGGGFDDI